MNNPLGIKNNTWHFILAFVAMVVEIPLSFKLLILPFALWAVVGWTFFILTLAFWYEWRQAMNSDEVKRHGGLTAFQKDSKDDTKKALFGLFIGMITGFLIFIII